MFSKKNSIKMGIGLVALVTAASFTLLKEPDFSSAVTGDPKLDKLKYPAGFKAEHLYSPSENNIGSWVSMTFDNKGRMICSDQYGKLFRLKIPAVDSKMSNADVEKLKVGPATDTMGMGYAHGLLYAFNSLYVMINNGKNNKIFTKKSGLYRLQDTDNDDQFDKVTLLKELVGEGEHGPHSIVLSPDKQSLFVIAGNHTDVPPMDAYKLPSNWKEDQMFPLIKDPRGHANDRYAPGGWIANLDPEGKKWELVSAGYRNAFDMAFNENGDLFVYDADMEWDFGLPWYRPTRICHATSASEFGWRTGNSKWSPTFPDNLPPVLNIGQGSPTNLLHLKDAKFPAKYKSTLLAFDWTFGVIHAIHLKPSGSTYSGEREEFLSGIPLPLTDGAIGPDGALYFLTGGRRLDSDLYRVSYVGNESTAPVAAVPINSANALRRSLEKFHTGGPNPVAVATAWPQLKSPDRFIRYAARLALEHQPVAQWQDLALKEKDPVALTQSLISLIRMGDGSKKNEIVNALLAVNFKALQQSQQLDLLRAFELAFLRMGQPDAALRTKVIAYLNPLYPANTAHLNRSLSKLLIYLDAPEAVAKTMALMDVKTEPGSDALNVETATASSDLILRNPQYGKDIAAMLANIPPAQHTYYAVMLSLAKEGWTPALQDKYFKWYYDAFGYKGGNSYIGFLDRSLKLALKNVPDNKRAYFEKLAGAERLSKNGNDIISATAPKGPGRNWRMENALPVIEKGLVDRDFENGKAMFAATTCKMCHALRGDGGAIGPDLSQLYTRFSSKDMLESIIMPDKTVSDQYAATYYSLRNGSSIVGRLINEDKTAYYISQNPYAPNELEKVLKKNVISSKPSSASIMFGGLINSLNEDELKDLMAYLKSHDVIHIGKIKQDTLFNHTSMTTKFNIKPWKIAILITILAVGCKVSGSSQSEKGFKSIFDGKTLNGWTGDQNYWRVENGNLVGEITPDKLLKTNSFIVWQGGSPADFELKGEFNITEKGNSGINYRSVMFPDVPNAMKGYQADIDGAVRYTGQNYEERGRTTLAYRGQITSINAQASSMTSEEVRKKVQRNAWSDLKVEGSLGNTDSLKTKIKSEDWNSFHIIAKGNRLQHFINGILMSDVTDNDVVNGKSKGLIGVQVHVGPPMKVQYRNLRLKELK